MLWDHNQISMTFIDNEELKYSTLKNSKDQSCYFSDGDKSYFAPWNAEFQNSPKKIDLIPDRSWKMTELLKNKVGLPNV